jgi:prolyl-tRNA editing enzyme YbaK/EbsC (Cys-tRNA(Pro) deacylase)
MRYNARMYKENFMKQKHTHNILEILRAHGVESEVKSYPSSTRTAEDAAASIGCNVAQITKSLIFKTKHTNRPVLILASGTNRVDEKLITKAVGEKIVKADAQFVREKTGFAIGGVAPCGHKEQIDFVFIDQDLMEHDILWAAAGTPNTVFSIQPSFLKPLTDGIIISIK